MNIEFNPFASRKIHTPNDELANFDSRKHYIFGSIEGSITNRIPTEDRIATSFVSSEIQKYKNFQPSNLNMVKIRNIRDMCKEPIEIINSHRKGLLMTKNENTQK